MQLPTRQARGVERLGTPNDTLQARMTAQQARDDILSGVLGAAEQKAAQVFEEDARMTALRTDAEMKTAIAAEEDRLIQEYLADDSLRPEDFGIEMGKARQSIYDEKTASMNGLTKKYFEPMAVKQESDATIRNIAFTRELLTDRAVRGFDEIRNHNANLARDNFESMDEAVANMETAINSSTLIEAGKRGEMITASTNEVYYAGFEGLLDDGQYNRVLELLDDPKTPNKYDENLTAAQQSDLISRAQRGVQVRTSNTLTRLTYDVKNYVSALTKGGQLDPAMIERINAAKELPHLTESQRQSISILESQTKTAEDYQPMVESIYTISASDLSKTMRSIDDVINKHPDQSTRQSAAASARQAYNARVKRLQHDPVGYVFEYTPTVSKAYEDYLMTAQSVGTLTGEDAIKADAQANDKWQSYVEAVDAEQIRLGVHPLNMRILPNTQGIVDGYRTAMETGSTRDVTRSMAANFKYLTDEQVYRVAKQIGEGGAANDVQQLSAAILYSRNNIEMTELILKGASIDTATYENSKFTNLVNEALPPSSFDSLGGDIAPTIKALYNAMASPEQLKNVDPDLVQKSFEMTVGPTFTPSSWSGSLTLGFRDKDTGQFLKPQEFRKSLRMVNAETLAAGQALKLSTDPNLGEFRTIGNQALDIEETLMVAILRPAGEGLYTIEVPASAITMLYPTAQAGVVYNTNNEPYKLDLKFLHDNGIIHSDYPSVTVEDLPSMDALP